MTLDEAAAELYGIPPAEFVAARTEWVRRAREAGDKTLATAIGTLRRPTVAAWAVNLLAREAPEEVGALLDLGEALREAQRRLSGEQLRALTTRRQQVVNALTRKAVELAAARGQRLSESVARDIGGTLQAALADPEVGDQVRSGTLTAAATYDGFGPAALVSVPAGRKSAPAGAGETASRTIEKANEQPEQPDPQEALRRELEETLTDLESARAAVASAESDHDTAAAGLAESDTRVAALRTELGHAEDQRRFTAAAERSTREVLERARHRLEGLERRAEKVRKRLSVN
ncbi:hypothetical protein [Nocardia huaxiensis]|uniref:Uncharacterized protein n=1 Tax=Nocardia huaxiensis TaxID=2755382 RepID=A0A7D6VC39_9NOCA|nr:hypothetical protein [Nocardia huaxiensis]QLY28735.1 hypothetical protein H0264_25830 [Nocardia huaxiensis]UFS97790.1 hypothetical protein LPY97_07770 [Nocardia huaxiensis]